MNYWNSSGISEKFQGFHLFQSFSSNFPWLQWNSTGIPPKRWKDFLVGSEIWNFLVKTNAFHSIVKLLICHSLSIFMIWLWKFILCSTLYCRRNALHVSFVRLRHFMQQSTTFTPFSVPIQAISRFAVLWLRSDRDQRKLMKNI